MNRSSTPSIHVDRSTPGNAYLADRDADRRGRSVAVTIGAGSAKAATSFGSDLDPSVQPSNAGTAHECNGFEGEKCTWVMGEAYGNPGGEESPKAGKLKSVELIAGEAGSFKLQIVKTRDDGSSKLVDNGPKISYEGQTDENYDTGEYNVEKFKVGMEIPKNARLAIRTKETSTLRCSSGGPEHPPARAAARRRRRLRRPRQRRRLLDAARGQGQVARGSHPPSRRGPAERGPVRVEAGGLGHGRTAPERERAAAARRRLARVAPRPDRGPRRHRRRGAPTR